MRKFGRNTPCPCGSGKKTKKCCGEKINKIRNEQLNDSMAIKGIATSPYLNLFQKKRAIAEIVKKKEEENEQVGNNPEN